MKHESYKLYLVIMRILCEFYGMLWVLWSVYEVARGMDAAIVMDVREKKMMR